VGVFAAWWHDRRGAAAVQFIAVLPVFALIVIGFWAFYSIYSARDALCDATDEAREYLQVEGPRFSEDILYPDGWEGVAQQVLESELRSHQWYELVPVEPSDVYIWPDTARRSPEDMSEVSVDELQNNLFFVRVTKSITNPVAIFMPDAEGNLRRTLQISCQSVGFFEGDPIGPTPGPGGQRPRCPPVGPCTQGPPGGNTPTPCEGPNCTPTPECRVCNP
jgi:hypothetical protein